MWREIWLGLGILSWLSGFIRVGYIRRNGTLMQRTFVRPPFLIFLICGMPKSRAIPVGVMAIPALMLQLQGVLWTVYGLIYPYLQNRNLVLHGIVLFIGMVLIIVYAWMLRNQNSYELNEPHSRIN